MRLPVLLLLAAFPTALACAQDPCAAYARKLCNDLGAGHEECRNARRAAEDPTAEMREVCREALRSYEDVLRVLRRPPQGPASPPTPAAPSPPGPQQSRRRPQSGGVPIPAEHNTFRSRTTSAEALPSPPAEPPPESPDP